MLKLARVYFEVGHEKIKEFPPVKVSVTDETIKWNNELVYPEYVLRELAELGFTDYEAGVLKRNSSKLQKVIQDAKSKRSTWLDSWKFYEFNVGEGLRNKELLDYIHNNYCVIFLPKEEGVKGLVISFHLESFQNDKKVKKHINQFKEYKFGEVVSKKRVIGKPIR